MMRLALCLALLLAGCLDSNVPDVPVPEDAAPAPTWVTLYLDAQGSMSQTLGTDGEVPIEWGYQQWLDGTPPPAWFGDTLGAVRILEGNVTLFYQATAPTLSGGARPELTAWWGSDQSLVDHVFINGPDTANTGQVIEATSGLRIPAGGLVMSPDNRPQLRVGTYYLDGPQLGTMELLVGGATASRIELLVEPIAWQAMAPERILETTGSLLGGRCAATVNPTSEADSYHSVEVNDTVQGLTIHVQAVDTVPTSDIDLVVTGPNGSDMGGGHSSFGTEGAHVWWPNLAIDGPGTYTIRVLACTPQRSIYSITVDAFTEA